MMNIQEYMKVMMVRHVCDVIDNADGTSLIIVSF